MALAPTRATLRTGNLPVELTSFVGRRQGLAELKRALASNRLLTLTGAGGVGKTKLALRAGRESTRQYPDGVWFVELAPIQEPNLIPQAVFAALGVQDHSSSWAVSTLSDYLVDKRLLLVLDNCEHVHDAAAVLAGTLLRSCPDVRILATSRQALGVTGEVVIDVPTLALPEDGDASTESLLRSDAASLFVERASAVQQGFTVDAGNAAAVLSVCTHLDGIPLALELAAVRLKSLGLDALDRGISARLGALGIGDRSASPRQQTLEAAIDWSYQLLSEHERLLWARLSVFAGGFELDAAQAVCAGVGLDVEEIPALVGALVEKSVLKRRQEDVADRFRLLEPLRQFGLERLADAGDETGLRSRHLGWVRQLAADAGANDSHQVDAFDRVHRERSNVWSALDFCLTAPDGVENGVAICRDLWIYWACQGPVSDVRRLLADLLERLPSAQRSRGTVLWVAAMLAAQDGDPMTSGRNAEEALAIGRTLSDAEIAGWALQARGYAAYVERRWDDLLAAATESLSLARTMGSLFRELAALGLLAVAHTGRGELDDGIGVARDAIRLSEQIGESWVRAYLFQYMALAMLQSGDVGEAEGHARASLALRRDLGDLNGMATGADVLASIAIARGTPDRAATLLGAAKAMRRLAILEPLRPDHDRAEGAARIALGSSRFEAAHLAGLRMSRDQVVDFANEVHSVVPESPALRPSDTELLSRREVEVAQLVADGATNAQVAARLFISERTVESHLASIFNKLGVDSRLQVARWFASTQETASI